MVQKGFTSLVARNDLVEKLNQQIEQKYGTKPSKPRLSTYVQDLLWHVIEEDEILRKHGAFIEKVGIESDTILLKDNKADKIIEVVLREKDLYCRQDQRLDCVHVGFSWAIPEVYKVMNLFAKRRAMG